MMPLQVILATGGGDEAGLAVRAHDLAVEIEARRRVLPQRPLGDEPVEVLPALGIDFRRVKVRGGRQINFRLADVQEAERIAGGDLAGLLRRHHVVGQFADARGQFRFRAQRGKRFDGWP